MADHAGGIFFWKSVFESQGVFLGQLLVQSYNFFLKHANMFFFAKKSDDEKFFSILFLQEFGSRDCSKFIGNPMCVLFFGALDPTSFKPSPEPLWAACAATGVRPIPPEGKGSVLSILFPSRCRKF